MCVCCSRISSERFTLSYSVTSVALTWILYRISRIDILWEHLLLLILAPMSARTVKITRTGSTSARTITRARILLLVDRSQDQGKTDDEVAQAVLVHKQTVYNICRRYLNEWLDSALYEKPRPSQPPKMTGDIEAELVVLACSDSPEGRDRWTLQLLADKLESLNL